MSLDDLPVISQNADVQSHYVVCRRNGCAHKLAEMLAFQSGPFVVTDNLLTAGRGSNQFEGQEKYGDEVASIAKSKGLKSTKGHTYKSGLAEFPGDPLAWVPDCEARGYVQRLCEKRGWSSDGAVKYKAPEREPSPSVELADDIADEEIAKMRANNPKLAKVSKKELRKEVTEKMKIKV